jgi:hypothetical protein
VFTLIVLIWDGVLRKSLAGLISCPRTVAAAQTRHFIEKPKAIPFAKPIITRTPVVEVPTPNPFEVSQVAL